MKRNFAKDILVGLAVGDALGVPVEFWSRERLKLTPVTDMRGNGSHNQPAGTWSDDSSLAFCLADALSHGYDLDLIAQNFVKWYYKKLWTPHGYVFDIGITTQQAISELAGGLSPHFSGGMGEDTNGNGSLMRILPLVLHTQHKPIHERYLYAKEVSAITHAHVRSAIACFYYLEFARLLIQGKEKFEIYRELQSTVPAYLKGASINQREIDLFKKLFTGDIEKLPAEQISGSGYVLHTIEASIWCLLTTDNYKDAVLKAVNLGMDTDTTGCVTGGLAGLLYGYEVIPPDWVRQLARVEDILELGEKLEQKYS